VEKVTRKQHAKSSNTAGRFVKAKGLQLLIAELEAPSTPRIQLKMEAQLTRKCSRRDVVCSAER